VVTTNRKDPGRDGLFGGAEGVVCHLHFTRRGGILVEDDKE